jgi:hypothetical protein
MGQYRLLLLNETKKKRRALSIATFKKKSHPGSWIFQLLRGVVD